MDERVNKCVFSFHDIYVVVVVLLNVYSSVYICRIGTVQWLFPACLDKTKLKDMDEHKTC